MPSTTPTSFLTNPPLPQRLKLAAAWASLAFYYLYGGYLGGRASQTDRTGFLDNNNATPGYQ
jgi:hypothetical protein